jgi:hypothetical protein
LKLYPCLSSYTNINSKWIKDHNVRPESLKQLLEIIGNTLKQIGTGCGFLRGIPVAQQLRERMNKRTASNVKGSTEQKKQSLDSGDCPQNGKKSLPAIQPIMELYSDTTGISKNSIHIE